MSGNKLEESFASLLSDVLKFLDDLKNVKLSKQDLITRQEIIEKISKVREDYPQLKNINVETASFGSQVEEFYEDIESEGFVKNLKKGKSSPNLSASNTSSEDVGTGIKGFLIRKSAGKSKIGFVSKLKDIMAKKYCVVENGTFSICDNVTKKPSTSFHLYGYEVKVPQGQTKEFIFDLVHPGKSSFHFATGSKEELSRWTNALNSEVKKNTYSSPSLHDKVSNEEYDDGENYEETDEYRNNKEAEKKASSYESEGEEYDDIELPPIKGRVSTPVSKVRPPSPAVEDMEELYDDIENTPKPVNPSQKSQRAMPPAPTGSDSDNKAKAAGQKVPANKPAIVSGKDGLPYDKMFYGKWDCSSSAKDELSFKHGDIMTVLSQEFDSFGWWVAELKGIVGLVPRDYLTPAYELITSK